MLNKWFDLAIIGSGPGGYVAAIRGAQLGLKVCIIEKEREVGGICLHKGCIPVKTLLYIANILKQMRGSERFGIKCEGIQIDIAQINRYKDSIIQRLARGIKFLLKKNNVTLINGFARVVGPDRLEIQGKGYIKARNIIIATGSRPKVIPGLEFDGKGILSSDDLIRFKKVPKSLLVIGAGAIGLEFAEIFLKFGSEVTVVEIMKNILPQEDKEITGKLEKILRKRGMRILTDSSVESLLKKDNIYEAKIKTPKNLEKISIENILVAVGRVPNVEGIGLDKLGIEIRDGFINVNEVMQTNVPSIFAIGDVVSSPQLAHVASHEAIVAVEKVARKSPFLIDYKRVPNCTFCEPQVASIGLTEEEANRAGLRIKIGRFPFRASGAAHLMGDPEGLVKIIVDENRGTLLGLHILHAHASFIIGEACVMMDKALDIKRLSGLIHPHPTLSEGIQEAIQDIFGLAIHI